MVQSYSPGGVNVHPSSTRFLGPTQVHKPNSISISSATFAQLMALQQAARVHIQNGIAISSEDFAGSQSWHTDWQMGMMAVKWYQ